MKSIDAQDDLTEEFEPAPLPPIGPDGAPMLEPLRPPPRPPPRLCEAGPCRNYHRFEIQTEAEDPLTQRLSVALPTGTPGARPFEGGTLYKPPSSFHVQINHYCYPTIGVEMHIGALPVIKCNRWNPYVPDAVDGGAEYNRHMFLNTEEGRTFTREVEWWREEREQDDAAAAEADRLIAQSLAQSEAEHVSKEKP